MQLLTRCFQRRTRERDRSVRDRSYTRPRWAWDGGNGSVASVGDMEKTVPPTVLDVFEVLHLIIQANPDLTPHEVWVLAHIIVFRREELKD